MEGQRPVQVQPQGSQAPVPTWGFGMAPIRPEEQVKRRRAAADVRSLLDLGLAAPVPPDRALASLSQVKGLFARVGREDQWDWFTTWMQLGRINPRKQALPAAQALAAIRNAHKTRDPRAFSNARDMFLQHGGGRALALLIDGTGQPHEHGFGYVYVLSSRADPRNLRIGYVEKDIAAHVAELNAGGDPTDPLGVRAIWVVRDDARARRQVERALAAHEVATGSGYYNLAISDARRLITAAVVELKTGIPRAHALPTLDVERAPQHPEAAAAEVRRRVIQRVETDWHALGFNDDERDRWVAAGVPHDRAHWAAMCRDSRELLDDRLHLTEDRLRTPINASGDTPLDAFANGQNLMRIQARLASAVGLSGVPGVRPDLLALTAEGFSTEYTAAQRAVASLAKQVAGLGPSGLPTIARQVARIEALARPIWQARLHLAREIDTYRTSGALGELLAAFARAHGVYDPGAALADLSGGLVGSLDELENAARVTSLIGRAAESENLLYMDPGAVAAASSYLNAVEEFRDTTRSPYPVDPRGFALIAATDVDDDEKLPARFLAWELDGERINAALVSRGRIGSALLTKARAMELLESWHPRDGLDRVDGAVRHTRLLHELAREAYDRARQASDGALGPRQRLGRDDPGTVLVYTAASADQSGTSGRERRAPDHRWKVRGHWRRQWYPSENDHKVIWIDEHTSGPGDRPLIRVERVRVIKR